MSAPQTTSLGVPKILAAAFSPGDAPSNDAPKRPKTHHDPSPADVNAPPFALLPRGVSGRNLLRDLPDGLGLGLDGLTDRFLTAAETAHVSSVGPVEQQSYHENCGQTYPEVARPRDEKSSDSLILGRGCHMLWLSNRVDQELSNVQKCTSYCHRYLQAWFQNILRVVENMSDDGAFTTVHFRRFGGEVFHQTLGKSVDGPTPESRMWHCVTTLREVSSESTVHEEAICESWYKQYIQYATCYFALNIRVRRRASAPVQNYQNHYYSDVKTGTQIQTELFPEGSEATAIHFLLKGIESLRPAEPRYGNQGVYGMRPGVKAQEVDLDRFLNEEFSLDTILPRLEKAGITLRRPTP